MVPGVFLSINKVKYPGNDPTKSPGKDWQWEVKGEQGSGQGNYTNSNW